MNKNKDGNWFKRHKILTGLGILLLVGIIAAVANGGGSGSPQSNQSTNTSATQASGTKPSESVGLNQPARDGKFQFTVSSVKCGITAISDDSGYLSKNAQGQFCKLSVAVKNTGDEAQTFDGSNQYLFNASGQKYTYDSEATTYANPSNSTLLNTINPGNSATGVIVFDLPKGEKPVSAELHDSAFSNGVKVNLQ